MHESSSLALRKVFSYFILYVVVAVRQGMARRGGRGGMWRGRRNAARRNYIIKIKTIQLLLSVLLDKLCAASVCSNAGHLYVALEASCVVPLQLRP